MLWSVAARRSIVAEGSVGRGVVIVVADMVVVLVVFLGVVSLEGWFGEFGGRSHREGGAACRARGVTRSVALWNPGCAS